MKISDFKQNSLAVATELHEMGLQVVPAAVGKGVPIVKWSPYQQKGVNATLLRQWFSSGRPLNYWVMTGHVSGYIVIDADSIKGDEWWASQLGRDVLESAAIVQTKRGKHYWFKIPEDWTESIPSWSVHSEETGISFDFRADLTGVIVPPSVHKSGHVYTWLRPLDAAADAPLEILDGSIRALAPAGDASAHGEVTGTGGITRSMLVSLLSNPPGAEGSGRNDWMARVAGHYAKMHHGQRDLYDMFTADANSKMAEPLSDKEFEKTVNSIWDGEHKRNTHRELDGACGWLESGNVRLMCQVIDVDQQGNKSYDTQEYANFDLVAKGVMLDEESARTYWVEIVKRDPADPSKIQRIETVLSGGVFGDDRALQKWLARFACSVLPPPRIHPREGKPGVRLQRYLESQHPPEVKVSKVLGYDFQLDGFVTHDGMINQYGPLTSEESGVTADPVLKKGSAPHHYGFDFSVERAREVLAEVLTFHHDETTAVFGAWWAACLLKPQIEVTTALFPFMAIQAPSESGKTNGFFHMMTELNGNTRGETQPTRAALRDMAAANRNGIVWVDDLDDPAYLMELLRAATSGGSLTKMGEDRETVKNTAIVAPICISGEALGIEHQKALVDRAIPLAVSSPTGRRSAYDESKPQWDDILDIRRDYPEGLSVLAGWLVQEALGQTDRVLAAVQDGRRGIGGRAADKIGILRAGARLLDYLVGVTEDARESAWDGTGTYAVRLEEWLAENSPNEESTHDNSLTRELLPWAVRKYGYIDKPVAGEHGNVDSPIFFKNMSAGTEQDTLRATGNSELWFNTALLAEAWEREKHGRVSVRTQSQSALKEQANAIDCPSKRFKIQQSGGKLGYYRKLSGPLLSTVIERAQDK